MKINSASPPSQFVVKSRFRKQFSLAFREGLNMQKGGPVKYSSARLIVAIFFAFCSQTVLASPTSLPSTSPATQHVQVDLSSWRTTMMTVANALEQGDADAFQSAVLTESDEQKKALEPTMRELRAWGRLYNSATSHFGATGVDAIVDEFTNKEGFPTDSSISRNLRENLKTANPEIVGNEIQDDFGYTSGRLVRRDGKWFLYAERKDWRPESKDEVKNDIEISNAAIEYWDKLREAIDSGKVKTAADISTVAKQLFPHATPNQN